MKKVFTLAFALFICSAAFAQFTNAKSGSRGGNSGGVDFGEMSYKGFVEAGYAIGLGDDKNDKMKIGRFDISTSHGVYFCDRFFAGLGTGVKYFSKDSENFFNIPIFADLRVDFLKDSNFTPFVGCKIGYAIGIEKKITGGYDGDDYDYDDYDDYYDDYYKGDDDYYDYYDYYDDYSPEIKCGFGGFICTPTIGCRYGINEKNGVMVSIGYDIQKGKMADKKFTANGLVFKVGIDF